MAALPRVRKRLYDSKRKGGAMEGLFRIFDRFTRVLNGIGAVALTFMMCLTVADVIGRAGGRPVIGTFEIVSLSLTLVIGLGIPRVSLDRAHVQMEFVLDKLSPTGQAVMNTFTRVLCLVLFVIMGYHLFGLGSELHASGDVTATIRLPYYPLPYAIGVCCYLECLVFVFDIVKIWRVKHD
jgi:TRAP-type C4-dicarboxylate transport system permease small subunit